MSVTLFFKMLAATIMSLVTCIGSVFGAAPVSNPVMIGHRGYSGIYPDNTAIAFKKAVEHGSGGCETDVRKTADGVYVTNHNSTVELSDGRELEISASTYEELTSATIKGTAIYGDVYLCTYREYLEIMRDNDMVCFIELKGEYTDEEIVEIFAIADEVYDLQKCILQSFNKDNLIKARMLIPDLPIMLTADADTGDYSWCFDYNISIDCEYTALTEEMIEDFHSHGLVVAAWTCNDIFSLSYCKSLGLDYIESDYF